jgi:hypothetical protein
MQTKWQRRHIGFVAYFLSHTDWSTQLDLDPLTFSWAGDGCRGDLDLAATVCSLAQMCKCGFSCYGKTCSSSAACLGDLIWRDDVRVNDRIHGTGIPYRHALEIRKKRCQGFPVSWEPGWRPLLASSSVDAGAARARRIPRRENRYAWRLPWLFGSHHLACASLSLQQ